MALYFLLDSSFSLSRSWCTTSDTSLEFLSKLGLRYTDSYMSASLNEQIVAVVLVP